MDYSTDIPTHPSTQYRYALGIRLQDTSRTLLGRSDPSRITRILLGPFSDACRIRDEFSLMRLRDARESIPAGSRNP